MSMYLVPVWKILAPTQASTQTLCLHWTMVASIVIGQLLWDGVFSEAAQSTIFFNTFLFTHIDMESLLRQRKCTEKYLFY